MEKTVLKQFLYSIDQLTYENCEVIIVDNGSTDNTIQYIKTAYPNYRVVVSRENLGTSGGSNIGASCANGKYIFFTSNDMVYDPYLIDAMVKPLEEEKIGAVACKVRYMTQEGEGTNIIDSVGGGLDIFGFPNILGNREEDTGKHDRATEVFFAFGCSILIRRDIFKKLDGYDSKLFTLGDDIDLCWRLRLLGYSIWYEPKALLFHSGSATIGSAFKRSQTRYMSERHSLRMLLKNYSTIRLVFLLPFYFTILTSEFCFYIFTGNPILSKSLIKAVFWNVLNIRDTLTQRKISQKQRRIGDDEIIGCMMKIPNKFREFHDFMKNNRNDYWKQFFGKNNNVRQNNQGLLK